MVGSQPALSHSGPASEGHHGQQVVQHPAGSSLQEETVGGKRNITLLVVDFCCLRNNHFTIDFSLGCFELHLPFSIHYSKGL